MPEKILELILSGSQGRYLNIQGIQHFFHHCPYQIKAFLLGQSGNHAQHQGR